MGGSCCLYCDVGRADWWIKRVTRLVHLSCHVTHGGRATLEFFSSVDEEYFSQPCLDLFIFFFFTLCFHDRRSSVICSVNDFDLKSDIVAISPRHSWGDLCELI